MASAVPEQMTPERGASGAAAQQRTALLSVMAAVFLVALKLATGLVTGSLGLSPRPRTRARTSSPRC